MSAGHPGPGPASGSGRDPRLAAFADSHLLLLDPDLEPTDVVGLLRNLRPRLSAGDPLPGEGGARAYRLSRHSQLSGPFPVDAPMARDLSLPADASAVYALSCPRDREPVPPPEWLPDVDGLAAAFPQGLPCREEGRVLDEVIAVARRLRLAVRLADEPGMDVRILHPDPDLTPNLFIYSSNWLPPDLLLAHVARVAPQARHPRPPKGQRGEAHSEPAELDAYAVEVPLEEDLGPRAGFLEIQVHEDEHLPPSLVEHLPTPQIVYTLRWVDTDNVGRFPDIDDELRAIRAHAIRTLETCAAAIMTAAGGAAVDEAGFFVSVQQLRDD
jgi:hypothetical protein